MEQLVERNVGRLYQGVSKQPDHLMLEGHVKEADNVWLDIVTNGVERRSGSRFLYRAGLNYTPNAGRPYLYGYNRDNIEQYMMFVHSGSLEVLDLDGVNRFTTSHPYLATDDPENDIVMTTLGDTTLVLNRSVTTAMGSDTYYDDPYKTAVVRCVNGDANYGDWTLKVNSTVLGVGTQLNAEYNVKDKAQTNDVVTALAARLQADTDAVQILDWVADGSYLGITTWPYQRSLSVTHQDFWGDNSLEICNGNVRSTNDLPERHYDGSIVRVGTSDDDSIWMQFSLDESGDSEFIIPNLPEYFPNRFGRGFWKECPKPKTKYKLDASTLPHKLVRKSDGTWELTEIEWGERPFGFSGDIFEPGFIGKKINNLMFHRDRLFILYGEELIASRQGDYFTFFPENSVEVLDTDPFSRGAASDSFSFMEEVATFRGKMFVISSTAQFELVGEPNLTPKNADLEVATQYPANTRTSPVVLGSQLYFCQSKDDYSILYEYYFNEQEVSHIASDVTLHVRGYIPGGIRAMVGDANTGTVFMLSEEDDKALYVYRTRYEGTEKLQSSWFRWTFHQPIENIRIVNGQLYTISAQGDGYNIYEHPIGNTSPIIEEIPHDIHLDYLKQPTQVTKSEGFVTLTVPNAEEALSVGGGVLFAVYPDGDSYYASVVMTNGDGTVTGDFDGDFSDLSKVWVGRSFAVNIELPSFYVVDENGGPITTGRVQLNKVNFQYKDTTNFDVNIERPGRPTKTSTFTVEDLFVDDGYRLGNIETGVLGVTCRGRGSSTKVRISTLSAAPFKLIGYRWRGFFSQVS